MSRLPSDIFQTLDHHAACIGHQNGTNSREVHERHSLSPVMSLTLSSETIKCVVIDVVYLILDC